jgi:guanine deaminase
LVLGDRLLHDKLHTTAEAAYSQSTALATKWHAKERLRYAVTPRFSLSCSEAILEVCGTLLEENPDLFFTSHLNEQSEEIAAVSKLFPWTQDYLETYDRYGLVTRRSVFAHNVHPQERELERLAQTGSSICHCPSSNMFIGSGLFPLQKHLKHGVHVALGSDVGGGTGFSLLKEGLMAYQGQMLLAKDGYPLTAAHLLYLATAAGARALALENEVGDLQAGKQADFVLLRPQAGSTLEAVLAHSPSAEASLAALFTLAQEDAVAKVYVAGKCNFARA